MSDARMASALLDLKEFAMGVYIGGGFLTLLVIVLLLILLL